MGTPQVREPGLRACACLEAGRCRRHRAVVTAFPVVRSSMAFWLFNVVPTDIPPFGARERAVEFLEARTWDIGLDERHRNALSAGDLVLIYLAAPARVFIARAELASSVRPLTPVQSEPAQPGGRSGVLLGQIDWWDPPVAMEAVLARIGPGSKAKADFDHGVVGITRDEFEAAVAVASNS